MKRIIVSVTNDLSFDQRVAKTCASLHDAGFEVSLIGRRKGNVLPIKRPYRVRRIAMLFEQGFLFYASFNARLFFILLFSKADAFWANDLDTLPANAFAATLRRKILIYDSHEFFTEVPEVQSRKWVKAIWSFLEKVSIGAAKLVTTVNQSIADALQAKYSLGHVQVLRNVADTSIAFTPKHRSEWGWSAADFLVVLQGRGINIDRGGEELVDAIALLDGVSLMIVGGGDVWNNLQSLVANKALTGRVCFIPAVAYAEMLAIIAAADVGMSLDKASNKNYEWSLPNKIFDYSLVGLPIIASRLPEVSAIVEGYAVGITVESVTPHTIAAAIELMRDNPTDLATFAANTVWLNADLDWQKEFQPIVKKLHEFFQA